MNTIYNIEPETEPESNFRHYYVELEDSLVEFLQNMVKHADPKGITVYERGVIIECRPMTVSDFIMEACEEMWHSDRYFEYCPEEYEEGE